MLGEANLVIGPRVQIVKPPDLCQSVTRQCNLNSCSLIVLKAALLAFQHSAFKPKPHPLSCDYNNITTPSISGFPVIDWLAEQREGAGVAFNSLPRNH